MSSRLIEEKGFAVANIRDTEVSTTTSSDNGKDEDMAKTYMAVISPATFVATQCAEATEAMGAKRKYVASVIISAVNV
ncbi:hypothetical protein CQW23_10646 [Capsicum baccatum]|uniref:VAN3-binding protein-like auxin canalisation domain-containing protein n=1 Tax=Capsicum baccatum TaxID=33114 RepID=A0A2G2X0E9_CAPBA|nr:hypothetical protein CQW23_10646 [Capsicum baccatum]